MKLTLVKKQPEIGTIVSFFWQPETPISWQAGQFMVYTLPHDNPDAKGIERYFTIASAPQEKLIRLTTHVTESSFKQALNALPLGATISAGGPDGDFVVDSLDSPKIFIAGGIGITPYRAILLDLSDRGLPLNIHMLYANRDHHTLYQAELKALQSVHPEFRITYILNPEQIDRTSLPRYITDIARPEFFVSGPEPMVQAVMTDLTALGVPERHQQRDEFPGYDWPEPHTIPPHGLDS